MAGPNSRGGSDLNVDIDVRMQNLLQDLQRMTQLLQSLKRGADDVNRSFTALGKQKIFETGTRPLRNSLGIEGRGPVSDAEFGNVLKNEFRQNAKELRQFTNDLRFLSDTVKRYAKGIGDEFGSRIQVLRNSRKVEERAQEEERASAFRSARAGVAIITQRQKDSEQQSRVRVQADIENRRFDLRKQAETDNFDRMRERANIENQRRTNLSSIPFLQQQKLSGLKQQQAVEANPEIANAINQRNFERTFGRLNFAGGAGLFATQARLLLNYAGINQVINSVQFLLKFTVDLDAEFRQLQAITATTDTGMIALRDTLISVSEQTKFTALEVAKASTILGQAGFSVEQIKKAIGPITKLATASGSDLTQAVDVVTSVINVFNLSANEAGNVANTLTSALNLSKLTMEKLVTSFGFAGNVAANLNVSFTDLTATIAAFANAGVSRGSTLGTGLRQLLIDLTTPTEKLKEALASVGLTTADVDVRSQGLIGVLKNMKDAGFSTADAFKGLEVRAANAFLAISSQLDTIESLRRGFLLSNAAAEANTVQMRALSNVWKQFVSIVGTTAFKTFEPFVAILHSVVQGLSRLATISKSATGLFQALIGTVSAFGLSFAIVGIGRLTAGLFFMVTGLNAAGIAALSLNARLLLLLRNPVFLIFAGLVAAGSFIFGFSKNISDSADALDKAKAKLEELKGKSDDTQQSIASLNKYIDDLGEKSNRLTKNQDELATELVQAEVRFRDMGLVVSDNVKTVDDLVHALQRLRGELSQKFVIELAGSEAAQRAVLALTEADAGAKARAFGEEFGSTRTIRTARGAVQANREIDKSSFAAASQQIVQDLADRLKLGSEVVSEKNNLSITLTRLNNNLADLVTLRRGTPQEIAAAGAKAGLSPAQTIAQLDKDIAFLSNAINRLEPVLKSSDAIRGLRENNRVTSGQLNDERFRAINQPALDQLQEAGRRFQNSRVDILRNPNDKERLSLLTEAANQLNQDISGIYQVYRDALKEDPAQAAQFNKIFRPQAALLVQTAQRTIEEQLDENFKAQRKLLEDRKRNLEAETKNIEFKLRGASEREVVDLAPRLREVTEEINKINDELTEMIVRKLPGGHNTALRDAFRRESKNANLERGEHIDDVINRALENAQQTAQAINNLVKDFRNRLAELDHSLNEGLKAAERPFKEAKVQKEAAESPGNRFSISDLQRELISRKVDEAQVVSLAQKAEILKADIVKRSSIVDDLAAQIKDLENSISLDESIRTSRDSDKEAKNQAQRRTNFNRSQVQDLDKQRQDAVDHIKQDVRTLEETLDDLRIRSTKIFEEDLPTLFSFAAQRFREEMGLMKSDSANFADNFTKIMRDSSDAISGFLTEIETGTKGVGDAFKAMAVNILKSMLKVINDRIAAKFVDLFVGLAASLFTGSAFTYSSSSSTPNFGAGTTTPGYKAGGYIRPIRAAGGTGVPGRDSVPILAQPGEFVLRKSAVDLIGVDSLEKLNAQGNRVVSSSNMVKAPANNNGAGLVNVWVVSKDQVPPPGPNDIIAAVGQDIATGGRLKKLIKQVQIGAM